MFDTHCHLNISPLYENHKNLIDDARKKMVDLFLIPATNIQTAKKGIEIADNFKNVYVSVGVHPTEI